MFRKEGSLFSEEAKVFSLARRVFLQEEEVFLLPRVLSLPLRRVSAEVVKRQPQQAAERFWVEQAGVRSHFFESP